MFANSVGGRSMATFTVRVEMYAVRNYNELNKYMREAGFRRVITVGDIRRYLPRGEYTFGRYETVDGVLKLAKLAAAKTGHSHSILVTECMARRTFNLKRVPSPPMA